MYKPKVAITFNNGGQQYAVTPADLATIYNLNPLFSAGHSGKGRRSPSLKTPTFTPPPIGPHSARSSASPPIPRAVSSKFILRPNPAPATAPIPASMTMETTAKQPSTRNTLPPPRLTRKSKSPPATTRNTTFGGQIALQNLLNGAIHAARAYQHQLRRLRIGQWRRRQRRAQQPLSTGGCRRRLRLRLLRR